MNFYLSATTRDRTTTSGTGKSQINYGLPERNKVCCFFHFSVF